MSDNNFEDFTELEFLAFVRRVFQSDFATEYECDQAVEKFLRLAEHPSGTNLLAYPDPSRPDSPEGIVAEIKAWRAANGKPGFKD